MILRPTLQKLYKPGYKKAGIDPSGQLPLVPRLRMRPTDADSVAPPEPPRNKTLLAERKVSILYTDGGCYGNTQKDLARRSMRYAVARIDGSIVVEGTAEGGSNNIAELIAVVEAVKWAKAQGWTHVSIRTDSKNNLSWVKRRPGADVNDRARVLNLQAELIALAFPFQLTWIPREKNLAGHYLDK